MSAPSISLRTSGYWELVPRVFAIQCSETSKYVCGELDYARDGGVNTPPKPRVHSSKKLNYQLLARKGASINTYLSLVLFMTSSSFFARDWRPTAHGDWLKQTDRDAHARCQDDDHGDEVHDEEKEKKEATSEAVLYIASIHQFIDFIKSVDREIFPDMSLFI